MPIQVNYVDTFQTRFMSAFKNLTLLDSTTYPAITTKNVYPDPSTGLTNALTSYNVYDQWALRTYNVS
jgi:hypothetical protein